MSTPPNILHQLFHLIRFSSLLGFLFCFLVSELKLLFSYSQVRAGSCLCITPFWIVSSDTSKSASRQPMDHVESFYSSVAVLRFRHYLLRRHRPGIPIPRQHYSLRTLVGLFVTLCFLVMSFCYRFQFLPFYSAFPWFCSLRYLHPSFCQCLLIPFSTIFSFPSVLPRVRAFDLILNTSRPILLIPLPSSSNDYTGPFLTFASF